MSAAMAREAREAARRKVGRLTAVGSAGNAGPGGDPSKRIDASGWAEPDMNADAQTGMRPVSRRQFKHGGHVSGEHAAHRADRKARKNGGHINAKINRNVREANAEIAKPHIGGFADGGATNFRKQMHGMMGVAENLHGRRNGVGKFHRSHKAGGGPLDEVLADDQAKKVAPAMAAAAPAVVGIDLSPGSGSGGANGGTGGDMKRGGRARKADGGSNGDDGGGILKKLGLPLAIGLAGAGLKKGGRAHKADGGGLSHGDINGMRPKGDRIPRKHGGKAKGKTNIIIGIHAGGAHPAPQQAPGLPPRPAMAPPPPPMPPPQGGAPMGAGAMPPGMMPPGMPMPRKSGGRTKRDDGGRAEWAMSQKAKNLRDDNEVNDLAHRTGNPAFDPMAPERAFKRLRDTGSLKYKSGGKVVGAKYGDASIAKAERGKLSTGAGGGLGRLAKAARASRDGFKPV